jgi:hypothetical protein
MIFLRSSVYSAMIRRASSENETFGGCSFSGRGSLGGGGFMPNDRFRTKVPFELHQKARPSFENV